MTAEWEAALGSPSSAFTLLLRSDAVMLMAARRAMEEHGDGPEGVLAARRVLDAELQASSGWPTGEDYLSAAADYERAGRGEDAAFLRRVAGTDRSIDTARTRWNLRYQDRARTPADELIASIRQGSLIEFDPAGPYLGIDGASYEPGVLPIGAALEPIVVISGRGGGELVTGWPDYAAMSEWIVTRGSTASGPLIPPPEHRDCRTWQEDQILARLVNGPSDASVLVGTVPPATFTTDVRYDIYQAIVQVRDFGSYAPGDIFAAFARRVAAVPAHGLARYGGVDAPLARAYLARLAETIVTREMAVSVASALVQEDAHYASRAARPSVMVHEPVGANRPGRHCDYCRPEPPSAAGPSCLPRP